MNGKKAKKARKLLRNLGINPAHYEYERVGGQVKLKTMTGRKMYLIFKQEAKNV